MGKGAFSCVGATPHSKLRNFRYLRKTESKNCQFWVFQKPQRIIDFLERTTSSSSVFQLLFSGSEPGHFRRVRATILLHGEILLFCEKN
jgi:hypothetical protein